MVTFSKGCHITSVQLYRHCSALKCERMCQSPENTQGESGQVSKATGGVVTQMHQSHAPQLGSVV